MRDYIELETSPYNEQCVSVDSKVDYMPAMRREAQIFIRFLNRVMGPPPEGVSLGIKSNGHDFGSYLSVKCSFNDTDEVGARYAYSLEEDGPGDWDEVAKKELAIPLDQPLPKMRCTELLDGTTGKSIFNFFYEDTGENVGQFVPKDEQPA